MAALCVISVAAGSAVADSTIAKPIRVTSSIDGEKVFAHRVHWLAYPSLPQSKISEVEFLIDRKVRWVEHHRPYTYGGLDGDNYLVTSWLAPGLHRFTVRVTSVTGRRATDTVVARIIPSPAPPKALAGRWKIYDAGSPTTTPAGDWFLTIDAIGWRIRDTAGTGDLIDVAYLAGTTLELRGGIWTMPESPREGNGWCEDTNETVRYRWTVIGDSLRLALAGPGRCDDESKFIGRTWTRAG
jgi:hypothetical protein